MTSIRSRLITGILLGMTVFFAAGGVFLYGQVRATLLEQVERSLFADFQSNAGSAAAGLLKFGPRWGRGDHHDGSREGGERSFFLDPKARTEFLLQAWHEKETYKSLALGEADLPRLARDLPPVRLEEARQDDMVFDELLLPGSGGPGRACSIRFVLPPRRSSERGSSADEGDGEDEGPTRTIELVLAKPVGTVLETLESVRWLLLGTWLTCVVACAAILFGVVDRSLRPLGRLQRELGTLDAGRLAHRFSADGAPSELAPVVGRLNELLERLQAAFEREQSFTSDVAHELRTPLAGLRATLEVLLARRRGLDEHEEAAHECLAITRQTQELVESLLELARVASGRQSVDVQDVDLGALLRECWSARAAAAAARGLRLRDEAQVELVVESDPLLLRRVFQNLLDNAVEYADEGSTIELRTELAGPRARVVLTNACAGLTADVAARVCDAFWRADAARSAVGRHAGIGLSLCKRIAEQLGGTLEVDTRGERFEVALELEPARRAT